MDTEEYCTAEYEERQQQKLENRLLEEAHDDAMQEVRRYWTAKYGTDGTLADDLFVKCSNGDLVLCDEAQEVYNQFYTPQ